MGSRMIRRTAVVLSAGALAIPLYGGVAHAVPSGRAVVPGAQPRWATPERAAATPAASQKVSFTVVLSLRDAAAAERLAADVSDPDSADYGRYLTPDQFNARFAPT